MKITHWSRRCGWLAAFGVAMSITAHAQVSRERQAATTPQQAFEQLCVGNERFVTGERLSRDVPKAMRTAAAGQYPIAAVLTCLDSRVPAELIFDQGIGDIFCTRNAGNYTDAASLGGLEYAAALAGARCIVVLAHTGCGAVHAVCGKAQSGNLAVTLANLRPAVEAVPATVMPRDGGNAAFLRAVTEGHVRLAVESLRTKSEALAKLFRAGRLGAIGGVYDLASGRVTWLPETAINVVPAKR